MKKLLPILLLFFSCKKEIEEKPQAESFRTASSELTVIEQATPYNLYIPEDEGGWESPSGRAGLWNGFQQIARTTVNQYLAAQYLGKVAYGTNVKVCYYDCPIANGIPGDSWDTTINNPITRSGLRDYVVKGGLQSTPLSITVYSEGGVYLGRKKDEFYYLPTQRRIGAEPGTNHHGDTSFIWWGWLDNYNNTAIIPEQDGKFVIAVTMDYGAINPKTSLLPIRVTGNAVVLDTTAIQANAAKPPANLVAKLVRGRNKGVQLSWEGDAYSYCVERDGVMIAVWQDIRTFFDPNGNKNSVYRIISRNQGRIPDAVSDYVKPTK